MIDCEWTWERPLSHRSRPAAPLPPGATFVISDGAIRPLHHPAAHSRTAFEKERGVTSVSSIGPYALFTVSFQNTRPRAEQELTVYRNLTDREVSINLAKLHQGGLSFVVNEPDVPTALEALRGVGFEASVTPSVTMVSVY